MKYKPKSLRMIKSNHILYASFIVLACVTLFSGSVPFFWDGTFFSESACGMYTGSFGPFDFPENIDNVTFPVYSTYLCLAWKLFSKSLLVSHLAMLPFLLGISYEFYKLAKKFLDDRFVSLALILLLAEPTFMTQGLIMAYDIPLLYLFLLALNLLLSERYTLYSIILPVIALYSIRGLVLGLSLPAVHFFLLFPRHRYGAFLMVLRQHVLCIFVVAAWFMYHKSKTGWYLVSPLHEGTDEQLLSISMMLKQAMFITWKLIDFGRIALWLLLLAGMYIALRRNDESEKLRRLLLILFIPLAFTVLFMIPFSNPAGHRYFMFAFAILLIGACYMLQEYMPQNWQKIIAATMLIALLSGNCWMYPERFGNGWDSSLKVIPYFSLKEQMDEYISGNNIDPASVGTQYPLIADKRFTHLSDVSFAYTNVWRGPLNNYTYFLQSNVINTDIPEQVEEVKKNWILVKKLESGQVYISLYKNPG